MIDKVFYFFTFLILLILKPGNFEYFSKFYNFSISLVYFFLLVFFFLWHRKFDKNWMRFDVIFLLGYTIVHFQVPFFASIGIEPPRPYYIWINKEVVNYATWMSVVAINMWMFGYSLVLKKYNIKELLRPNDIRKNFLTLDYSILILFFGFIATVGSAFLRGVYDVDTWGIASVYILLVLQILIYIRIVYFFIGLPINSSVKKIAKSLVRNKVFAFVVLSYFILFLLSGSRGEILQLVLVTVLCYSLFIKSLSFKFIVISAIVGSVIFTIIGLGRVNSVNNLNDQGIFETGYSALTDVDNKKGVAPTNELASSVRIQYRAIDTVPQSDPYLYGQTYVTGLFGIVPFASGHVVRTFDIDTRYQGSSNYFTFIGQGPYPTYGEGSEILGDIYINFGIYGVFIVMLSFGILSGKIYSGAMSSNTKYILLYAVLVVSAITINRASLFILYKDFFYIFIFYLIFSVRKR